MLSTLIDRLPRANERIVLDFDEQRWVLLTPLLLTLLIVHLLARYPEHKTLRLGVAFPAVLSILRIMVGYRMCGEWPIDYRRGSFAAANNFNLAATSSVWIGKIIEWSTLRDYRDAFPKLHGYTRFRGMDKRIESNDKHAETNGKQAPSNGERGEANGNYSSGKGHANRQFSRSDAAYSAAVRGYRDAQDKITYGSYLRPLELDIIFNCCGIARGRRASQLTISKTRFALARIAYSITWYLFCDLLECLIKDPRVFAPSATASGGSLFLLQEGVLGWSGPYVIAACAVLAVCNGPHSVYALFTGLVILLHPDPDMDFWAPLSMHRVWAATSVGHLWSRHWHRYLRRTLHYCGYQPGKRLALAAIATVARRVKPGPRQEPAAEDTALEEQPPQLPFWAEDASNAIGTLAAFALSGLIHEAGQCMMSTGPGFADGPVGPVFLFFFWQGIAVVLEQVWTKATGRRVGGAWGWLWTYSQLMLTGIWAINIWFEYGFFAGPVSFRLMQMVSDTIVSFLSKVQA